MSDMQGGWYGEEFGWPDTPNQEAWQLDPRLCVNIEGRNPNICVAEGCFGEACCEPGWRPPPPREGIVSRLKRMLRFSL
jgi:hypothetical protein